MKLNHNFLMLETLAAKEVAVAQDVDRLVGCDSSYCPMYYELKQLSRRAQWRGKATKANVVIPRYIFVTASFPRLGEVLAIQGALRFGLNDHLQPEVIPGWQMRAFMESIEAVRQRALRIAEKLEQATKPDKPKVFKSFADAVAHYKAKSGESIDPETGEFIDMKAA